MLRMRFMHRCGSGQQLRRSRARCRQQQRCRRDARSHREGVAQLARSAQGLHPRRSAHALQRCRGCVAQDPRRATTARCVRVGHHRSAKGERHHPLTRAASRIPPAADGRTRTARSLGCRRCWPHGFRRSAAGRAHPRRRFGPRHAERARARVGVGWRHARHVGLRRVHRSVHRSRSWPSVGRACLCCATGP